MSTFKISENIDSKVDGVSNAGKNILPMSGDILPFAGTVAPNGWLICDGTNGTPDLRGYFLVGASSSANVGANHGSSSHTHNATANSFTVNTATSNNSPNGPHGYNSIQTGTDNQDTPNHTHSGTLNYGSGDAGSNLLANSTNANGPINFVNRPHSHSGSAGIGTGNAGAMNHGHNANTATVNMSTANSHSAGHNINASPSGSLNSASYRVPFISMNYIIKI